MVTIHQEQCIRCGLCAENCAVGALGPGEDGSIRCRELLCNGVPLAAIWTQCGFSGYSSMLRSFKQEFGVTPAEYYRQCCQRAREYPDEALPEQERTIPRR